MLGSGFGLTLNPSFGTQEWDRKKAATKLGREIGAEVDGVDGNGPGGQSGRGAHRFPYARGARLPAR